MPDSLVAAAGAAAAIPVSAIRPTDPPLKGEAAQWVKASGFTAAAGDVILMPAAEGGGIARVLLGVGDASVPLLPGVLPEALPGGTYCLADGFDDPAMASLAWALGAYRFTRYRDDGEPPRRLVIPDAVDAADLIRIADGVILARDLINTPANDMGPAELAEAVRALAHRHGAECAQIVGEVLIGENLPLIYAVGSAATVMRAPRLVGLQWGEPDDPAVTIVGKGVCFDTGGLDIKSASGMGLMKKDMGGAANALGLAHMIMDAGLRVRLQVLIPAVDNAIAANAFRPGDVLTSRSGLTVEIGNTDAEGRLVLADVLTLAAGEKPDLLVDLATLTGAARVAVGPDIVPFYTDDDQLSADLYRHGRAVADPVWRMPLWRPYHSLIESKIADINNAGASPFAGSITAALFLSRFVPDGIRWLHADIYAWNPSSKAGRPEGGEAQAIRALFALIKERYGK